MLLPPHHNSPRLRSNQKKNAIVQQLVVTESIRKLIRREPHRCELTQRLVDPRGEAARLVRVQAGSRPPQTP